MKLFRRKTKKDSPDDGSRPTEDDVEDGESAESSDSPQEPSERPETDETTSAPPPEAEDTAEASRLKKKGFWSRFKKPPKEETHVPETDSSSAGDDPDDAAGLAPVDGDTADLSLESPQGTDLTEDPVASEAPPVEDKKGFWGRFVKKEAPAGTEGSEEVSPESPGEMPAGEVDTESPETVATVEADQPEEKRGFFKRLRTRLSKTRKAFVNRVDALLLGKKEIDEALLEELEEILITSDIGVHTSMRLIEVVREKVERKDLNSPTELRQALQTEILGFLQVDAAPPKPDAQTPHVIMVVGVNGVGKTTTIGKLAARHMRDGKTVLLVAADTFRAAAVEQLEIWSQRVGCDMIKHTGKADPSAVAYDGIQAAKSRNVDVVIIDTAGRLHTKTNLMEELKKIRRTVAGQLADAPHEILLVLDATTGQNAISQAELFNEAIDLTGIALTKLDGTAKGGIVVGICESLGVPLRYIGIGENLEDLQPFDADEFIQALF